MILLDSPSGKKQFTYSRQGSILTEEGAEGTRRYVYNSRNQQIRVECENGAVQENYYDAEGLRHETLENEKLLRLVYHRGELLYEGGEREETSYYLGAGTEGIQRNGERFYYHQDEQLSEALMTDTEGRIQNHYQYDAFGAELNVMERIPNRIRYTGQQYDRLTEQYYLRARYYNPILGRFMQEDEYLGDGLNLYAYCENNPVMYYDPSGYSSYEAKVGSGIGDESGIPSGYYQDANGRWHRPNGQFASNTEVGLPSNSDHYLNRPYIRQETIDAVNTKTKVNYKTGQIYDSISRKWVDPSNVELGHTTGSEFAFYRDWAESQGWTQSQFNDFMNNPDFYAWQDIYSNRSHMFEAKH